MTVEVGRTDARIDPGAETGRSYEIVASGRDPVRGKVLLAAAVAAVGVVGAVIAVVVGRSPATKHAAPRGTLSAPGRAVTTPRWPLPNSGYAAGRTYMLIDGTGRAVTNMIIEAPCAPAHPLPPMWIRRDRTFGFAGPAPDERSINVSVTGHFVSAAAVTVRMRFVAGGCDSGVMHMTLRPS